VSLTGLPLLLLSACATVLVTAATIRLWRRRRPAVRIAGVLLIEALVVLTAGLEVNRNEQFYPSWQALAGRTGTGTVTGTVHAGVLDAHLPPGPFRWRPSILSSWRLAGTPVVSLPVDYRERTGVTFPVVLVLGATAPHTPDAITVRIVPTARTTAAGLRTLPGALRHDLRASPIGWDVVGGGKLGDAFIATQPAGLAGREATPDDLPPALAAPQRLPTS
jgi:lysyl-tRNA synthetase class 2